MSNPENSPLELIASGIEAETAEAGATGEDGQEAHEQEQPAVSNAEILTGALIGARDVFCLYTKLQSPARTAPDPEIAVVAQKWALVCDRKGWDLSKYLGGNMDVLAAGLATLTLARAVYAGVQVELAVLNAQTRTVPDAPNGDSTDPARPE